MKKLYPRGDIRNEVRVTAHAALLERIEKLEAQNAQLRQVYIVYHKGSAGHKSTLAVCETMEIAVNEVWKAALDDLPLIYKRLTETIWKSGGNLLLIEKWKVVG